jgi:hypothetical protein
MSRLLWLEKFHSEFVGVFLPSMDWLSRLVAGSFPSCVAFVFYDKGS